MLTAVQCRRRRTWRRLVSATRRLERRIRKPCQLRPNGSIDHSVAHPGQAPDAARSPWICRSQRCDQDNLLGEVSRTPSGCGIADTLQSAIGRSDNEKFLEQFGYVIVASQLLDEHRASTLSAKDGLPNLASGESATFSSTVGLTGAVVTAATSFFLVWIIHWSRPRAGSLSPWRGLVLVIVLPIMGIGFYAFARRQWLKFLRQQAVQAANAFIGNAKGFDSVVSASVLFIQEVELVSRGYRMSVAAIVPMASPALTACRSTPLPPISRLEESAQVRRCLRLRRTVSECLYTLLEKYVQAQRGIRALADSANLDKYYDIYEVTPGIIRDAEETLSERDADDQYSLRSLRALFARTHGIRKSILCCLLALKADGTGADIATWSAAVEEMCSLATVTGNQMVRIRNILEEQDRMFRPCQVVVSVADYRFTRRRCPSAVTVRRQSRTRNATGATTAAQLADPRHPRSPCKDVSDAGRVGRKHRARRQ